MGSTWKQHTRAATVFCVQAWLLQNGVMWTESQRPGSHPDDEFTRFSRMVWQSFAATEIDEVFFGTTVWPRLDPTHRALVRSQRGPMASILFFTPPVSTASRFDPQSFRVLLLRRLWCRLPLCCATCRCGQPLDSRGHHQGLPGCRSTFVSKTWTSIQGREQTTVVWKWSPTVCLSSTAHSLPWTPRWSALSELTEFPGGSVQNGMEPL